MSILTDGVVAGEGSPGGGGGAGGNAAAAAGVPAGAPDGAAAAIAAAQAGPPEHIPAKFWDTEKRAPRVDEMGKSYIALEKLLTHERVPIPLSDDDAEGWERWAKATGRPDKPDDYTFERPSGLPEGLPYDEEMEKSFRSLAHQNGLGKRQATNFYNAYVKSQLERHSAYAEHERAMKAQAEDAMRREHGAGYDGAIARSRAALGKFGTPDFLAYLDKTGLGNDPRMLRVFEKIGAELAGDPRLRGQPAPGPSAADLRTAITNFDATHRKALDDAAHPEHASRVNERNALFERLHPNNQSAYA